MRHGFLFVDKPVGPTSHDVVQGVRRTLQESSIGHLGTLDPLASGLLVLAVGAKALKVVELFGGLPKEYVAHIAFGAVSNTYDADGIIEVQPPKPGFAPPEQATLQRLLQDRFQGVIDQVPPAHSAVHVGGERAYRKARQGLDVVMPSRKVEITAAEIVEYAYPHLKLRVECGAGTYIRSLAHDLGQVMRCGAYLAGLRRTKVGEWDASLALAPSALSWGNVHPLKDVLAPLQKVEITEAQLQDLRHGKDLPLEVRPDTIAWCGGLPVAILTPKKDGSRLAHPRKVF